MKKESDNLDNSLKLLAKTSLMIFIILIFSKIMVYVYRIIIARYFGPEIYGLLSLSLMILGWFAAFSSFGLYEGVLRYTSFYRGKKEFQKIGYLFKFSIKILIFSSIFSGILLFFLSEFISIKIFHNSNLIIFLRISSFIIPFYLLSNVFLAAIQAFEKIKAYTIILDFIQHLIKIFLLVFFILINLNFSAVIVSYVSGILAIFLISFFYCKYKLPSLFEKYSLTAKEKSKIKREVLSYSWPLFFVIIVDSIFPWIDFFAIGYFKGVSEVGFYSAAVSIAYLLIFLPPLFLRLFFPMLTRYFSAKDINLMRELSKQIEKWIFIVNLPFFILMVLFPGVFINFLFGSRYLVAENSLRFLAIGYLFFSMTLVSHNLLSIIGKTKIIFIDLILVSILNIILNILLVPKYSLDGAAFSTMISQIILSFLIFFQVRHYVLIIPLRRKMFSVVISSIIPTFLLIYINQFVSVTLLTVFIQGTLFILLYLFFIFVTKSLDRNDLMILNYVKKSLFRL